MFDSIKRFFRIPKNDSLHRFEVTRTNDVQQGGFVDALCHMLTSNSSVLRAYWFRANVNEVNDVPVVGLVFEGKTNLMEQQVYPAILPFYNSRSVTRNQG